MSQKNRKLGRTSDQRRAMLRAMVTYLLENGQIKTTVTRAKEVAPVAEKMITLAKTNTLASYRQALSYITKEDVANKLFKEIGPKYADRNGGYTIIPEMHLPLLTAQQLANVRPIEGDYLSQRRIALYLRDDCIRERMLNTVTDTLLRFMPRTMMEERIARFGIRL